MKTKQKEDKIVELIIPMYVNKVTSFDLEVSSGEVVRCKECIYRFSFHCPLSIGHQSHVKDDYYCADGKRPYDEERRIKKIYETM